MYDRPEKFGIDVSELDRQYKQLQKQLHPDHFARKGQVRVIVCARLVGSSIVMI